MRICGKFSAVNKATESSEEASSTTINSSPDSNCEAIDATCADRNLHPLYTAITTEIGMLIKFGAMRP